MGKGTNEIEDLAQVLKIYLKPEKEEIRKILCY